MARISVLRSSNDRKDRGADVDEVQPQNLAATLADAGSTEERREAFAAYLDQNGDEFDADCRKVAKLLQSNDVDGLIEHGSRHIPEQAAARVAAIRDGR